MLHGIKPRAPHYASNRRRSLSWRRSYRPSIRGSTYTNGHHVILADQQSRLDAGRAMGAKQTVLIERGGGQAQMVRKSTHRDRSLGSG